MNLYTHSYTEILEHAFKEAILNALNGSHFSEDWEMNGFSFKVSLCYETFSLKAKVDFYVNHDMSVCLESLSADEIKLFHEINDRETLSEQQEQKLKEFTSKIMETINIVENNKN